MILGRRSVSLTGTSGAVVLIKWVSDVSRCCHIFILDHIYHMQIADKQSQESIKSMIKIQAGSKELETPIRLS
jgi:hypothetical protein